MAEEEAAQASSDAVAEAAASLQTPEVQQSMKDFVGRGGVEPPEEPVAEPPAEEQDEGRPTEPAEAAPDSEGEDVTDDYDPEAHADYGEDKIDEPPVVAKPEEAPEPTQPQDWSEEDQREFKEFRAFRESQRAEREVQEPQAQEPERPAPGATPTQDDLKGVIQGLMDTDPGVQRAVDNLSASRTTIQGNQTRLGEYNKEITEIGSKYARAQAVLEAQQEMAKDADMDQDFMRPRLQKAQQDVSDFATQQSRLMIEAERLERQTYQMDLEYREGVQTINRAGMDEWNTRARQAQEQTEFDDEYSAAKAEWNEILPRLIKDWGMDQSLTPIVREELARLSDKASDDDLARLEPWMRSQKETVTGRFDQIRQATLKQYAADKRADLNQPAPPPERASAPPREQSAPLSSKDASRLAGKNLVERLRVVR